VSFRADFCAARPHRGCGVRPGEVTANCAAVAAVSATAKAHAAAPPRSRNDLINVQSFRGGHSKTFDPKSICKEANRQAQACPPSAGPGGKADGAGASRESATEAATGSNAGHAGPGARGGEANAGAGFSERRDGSKTINQTHPGHYQGHGAHGSGPDKEECVPQSQGQTAGSHGQYGSQGQVACVQPSQIQGQAQGYQGQALGYQGQALGYQGQAQGHQGQAQGHQGQAQGYQGQAQGYQGQAQGHQGQAQGYQGQSQGYQGQTQGYQGHAQGYHAQVYHTQGYHAPGYHVPGYQVAATGVQGQEPGSQEQAPGSEGQPPVQSRNAPPHALAAKPSEKEKGAQDENAQPLASSRKEVTKPWKRPHTVGVSFPKYFTHFIFAGYALTGSLLCLRVAFATAI